MLTIVGVGLLMPGLDGSKSELFQAHRPARHDTVIHMAYQAGHRKTGEGEQGFITNKGTFVGRIEAAAIAKAAGQIVELQWPPLLYSEDLW